MAKQTWLVGLLGVLCGCASSTRNLPPVTGFEADRYLGTWYEAARYDHSFERGMTAVTANYSRQGEAISVVNRGYDGAKETWRQATARATFAESSDVGLLKVTFFWPFWGTYKVIDLDREGYQWAIVTSSTRRYLWLLTRSPKPSPELTARLEARAGELGFDTADLIWVDQSRNEAESVP